MKSLSVIHVVWIDSMCDSDWTQVDQVSDELELSHSVGIKVKETENSIVLALSYDPETDSVNCFQHIPFAAIKSVRSLCQIKMKK